MKKAVSRRAIIAAIVAKDLRLMSRDRLWMTMTPLALLFFVGLFWILPEQVTETIEVGVAPQAMATALTQLQAAVGGSQVRGLAVIAFASDEDLATSVAGEAGDTAPDVGLGIAFPSDFLAAMMQDRPTTVRLYLRGSLPASVREAMVSVLREAAFGLRGVLRGQGYRASLPVRLPQVQTVILGEDRTGRQVSWRDRFRPLLACIILMMEAMAIAGLVAIEVQHRTVTALLVTPARTRDLITAKVLTGAVLAGSQAVVLLVATNSLGPGWPVLLALILLAAVLVSAVGIIAGAAGKDFMGTLFYSLVFIAPLMIPAWENLLPGSTATWVKALPSYPFVSAVFAVTDRSAGWLEVAPQLGLTLLWSLVLMAAATVVLRRKVAKL